MTDCLLLLYWSDFARHGGAYPSAALVAHSLRRYVCALYHDLHAYVWLDDSSPTLAASFAAHGFRVRHGSPQASDLAVLTQLHPDATVILAMSTAQAGPLTRELEPAGVEVAVWPPERPESQGACLADILHLRTALSVGLLVESGIGAEGPQKAVHAAELVGALLAAVWLDPESGWSDLLRAASAPSAAATPLGLLRTSEWLDLHTWVLAGHGPWVEDAVRWAHAHSIRVLLWPPDATEVPPHVAADADACYPLELALRLRHAPSTGFLPTTGGVRADVRIEAHTIPKGGLESPDAGGEPRPHSPSHAPAAQSPAELSRLGPWVRLMYHFECTQRQNGWSRGPFRKMAAALAEVEEFGPTPANATMWLNRAKAEGLIEIDPDGPRDESGTGRLPVCRANPDHPICRAATDIPDRCLRLLFQMLQKIPWVSFKLLRSVLMREQWLGGPPYRLDEPTVDEWLNFLIHHGAIRMTKEPNLVNPDYPVTALRLNDEHPLSRSVVTDASESTRLAAERAILAVDHFLTRNRKPWMAMGALRRALDGMGRDELQAVLQGLQNLGALITESYPNPQKEHFTTGCRLKIDEPIVARALEVRNRIIQAAQQHARARSWVSLSRLSESLDEHPEAASAAQRAAWFLLLRDEGILELDQETIVSGQSWEEIRCRLNVSDAVVRSVIAGPAEGPAPYGEYD
jgi:hypothetical protein